MHHAPTPKRPRTSEMSNGVMGSMETEVEASPEYCFGLKVSQCSNDEDPLVHVKGLSSFFNELLEHGDENDIQRTRLESFARAFFPSVIDLQGTAPRARFLAMYRRGLPLWFEAAICSARESSHDGNDGREKRCTKLRAFFFQFLQAQFTVAKQMGKPALELLTWVSEHHGKTGSPFIEAINAVVSEEYFEEHITSMNALKESIVAKGPHSFLQPVGEPSEYEDNSFGQIARLFDLANVALPAFDKFMQRFARNLCEEDTSCKADTTTAATAAPAAATRLQLQINIAPIKSEVRTMEKYFNKGCDCRGVTDIVRGRIVCKKFQPTLDDIISRFD